MNIASLKLSLVLERQCFDVYGKVVEISDLTNVWLGGDLTNHLSIVIESVELEKITCLLYGKAIVLAARDYINYTGVIDLVVIILYVVEDLCAGIPIVTNFSTAMTIIFDLDMSEFGQLKRNLLSTALSTTN
ncbi:uncharacterized protein LOC129321875 [Prosopis cineraria]|uniref:uncharacterized protein LOC129321875 n=1 Tax=Prosopis cineraria TaxID=364024 RepID=UPI002410ACEB|nr:uncharacterized protein LOC129321875 [Prosopis cineraria]